MGNDIPWVESKPLQLLAAVPCEDATTSAAMADGRVSLQRLYYDVYAAEYPASFDRLNVATVWMGGEGEHIVGVRLSDPGGQMLAQAEMPQQGLMPPSTATVLMHLSNNGNILLTLPQPGTYHVDVLLDDFPLHTFPIYAIRLQTTEAKETTTDE